MCYHTCCIQTVYTCQYGDVKYKYGTDILYTSVTDMLSKVSYIQAVLTGLYSDAKYRYSTILVIPEGFPNI